MCYFNKIREVKSPCRANVHDAGIDFFLPKIDAQFINALKDRNPHIEDINTLIYECGGNTYLRLFPGTRVTIPTGIKVWITNKESALIGFNKSGLSANKGLIVTAQVVDADYTGEVHQGLLNTSTRVVLFGEGDKIGQFVHVPIILDSLDEVSSEQYKELTQDSDRGEGGFGSSDKR